ncbi:MAG: phosphoribosylaminoimidazolesuccinocarboxamide synthase [bacterium]|nr:phosphoribosylaminoimidazolesuccinocarboxamide synthase [bacterium]
MEKREKLYEGKAKILYATDDPNLIIQYFKDDATAFNAQKKGTIVEKGIYNNRISSHIFKLLAQEGVASHFVQHLSDREMLVKRVNIIPVEVVIRNRIAGSLAKRFGLAEGGVLSRPILEFYYKDDALGDPMINEDHIAVFELASQKEMEEIKKISLSVNTFLKSWFQEIRISLVDFKLEFGRYDHQVLLADEITPDGCRLWDIETEEKLDKDRFRRDLGQIEEAYREVWRRISEHSAK